MIKSFFNILLLLTFVNCNAQVTNFKLVSLMDGILQLENGEKITVWGYSWDTLTPFVQIPAPLLEINEGDSVNIRFRNLSPEAHTIHLHGLDVSQVNDGVPSTSFFVWEGDTANYSFSANYSGTYLYHCHVTTTLHLTMGMYGMIVVNYPGNTLYENGPSYDKKYHYLTSDISTTLNPISPPPFNEITPDYFMINGKSGNMAMQTEDSIQLQPNEKGLLRLGNIAYAKVKYIFPENVRAEVYMSDGRVLPSSFVVDTLEIYTGERFSVIISSDQIIDNFIQVEYYNVVSKDFKHVNTIPLQINLTSTISERKSNLTTYPNPFIDAFTLKNMPLGTYKLLDTQLQLIKEIHLNTSKKNISLGNNFAKGIYFLITPQGETIKLLKQ